MDEYEKSLEINKGISCKIVIRSFGVWKSPGIDSLQNHWWYKFSASHTQLTNKSL